MVSCPPILFLIFNRPRHTAEAFARIRQSKPRQLFVAADGPRSDAPNDLELCKAARKVTEQIDWDCEVRTLYRDTNLGCRIGVESAIAWFFEHVNEGVILEDDIVAEPSFFNFCADLLGHYRDDSRVMAICGESFGDTAFWQSRSSYVFSGVPLIWGWATWRRAWQLHQSDMPALDRILQSGWLSGYHHCQTFAQHWERELLATQSGCIDTWDYRWFLSVWANHGLCAMPSTNLVRNIGCDSRGTHTKHGDWSPANRETSALAFPINHPRSVYRDYQLDAIVHRERFGLPEEAYITTAELITTSIAGVGQAVRRMVKRQILFK